MAHTARKRLRWSDIPNADGAEDSTPLASKRIRVSHAQTARKSTGRQGASQGPHGGDDDRRANDRHTGPLAPRQQRM